MVTAYDPIRAEQERIENEAQNARAEFERSKPQPDDNASVRARKKSGKDRVRASAKADQEVREKYQAKYVGGVKSKPSVKAPSAGDGWVLEGNYGTRADANLVRRNLKSNGYFVKVYHLKDGTYSVWKKEGATVKSYKLKMDKGDSLRDKKDRGGSLSGGVARLTELGGLPEYKPPNFKLDKSGYTPLDYKPLENKPMFQYTGFKTMDYKPISTEPFYKQSGVGGQPYYRPLNYQPIGQFGSVIGNPPNISGLQRSSEAEPKKRRKKSKEPRIVA